MSKALRKPVSENPPKKKASPMLTPTIYMLFGLICFLTALGMGSHTRYKFYDKVSFKGGVVGPFVVKKKNSAFEVKATRNIDYGQWSFLSGEVLDENKNYLFSFGKELWAATGVDSEGYYWSERDNKFKTSFTIKKPGNYYIKISSENSKKVSSDIHVRLHGKRGSGVPHFIAGLISLIIGVIMYHVRAGLKKVGSFYGSMLDS